MKKILVRIFYPTDPCGIVAGGVDTFIRGLIKWSPPDIEFSVVGMTTDISSRPIGVWTRCDLGRGQFDIFPVISENEGGVRTTIPVSLRFTFMAFLNRHSCVNDFDVYEFHRIEPALLYLHDSRPKNIFFHTDMEVIRTELKTDILWRTVPKIYFSLESRVMSSIASAWSVRQQAVDKLRIRYPTIANSINYTPTWVDPEIFYPLPYAERHALRTETEKALGLDPSAFRIITVGRLDKSKDPELLLSSVCKLLAGGGNVELLFVGDGVLRGHLEHRVASQGISRSVRFLGLQAPADVARYLQSADCFALSSAYEGMPMALLEALGAGVPVVTTPVGEVASVVVNGLNGFITENRSEECFANRLGALRNSKSQFTAEKCLKSVEQFTPAKVLESVFENYRYLTGSRNQI